MDKKKATKLLVKELVRLNGQTFVVNPAHQKHLLEKAVAYCPVKYEEPFSFQFKVGSIGSSSHVIEADECKTFVKNYRDWVNDYCSKVEDANYVFTEPLESLGLTNQLTYLSLMNTFSFFALIGEEEERDLKRRFYKDVPLEIVCAMDTLGIGSYAELYGLYSSRGLYEDFLEDYILCSKLASSFTSLKYYRSSSQIGDFYTERCALEKFLGLGIKDLNEKLDKKAAAHLDTYYNDKLVLKSSVECVLEKLNENTLVGKHINLLPDFLDLVFTIPLEDQNIEANKRILELFSKNLRYIETLIREYSSGKNFQDYFSCLDSKKQRVVVDSLKSVPKRNPLCDSFLWSRGFKDIALDHLVLYDKNPEGFIEYFKDKPVEEKKVILKDVMEHDSVNEEVVNWLNENEADLLREVSFNG